MIALLLTRRVWLLASAALAACGGGGGSPGMAPVLPVPTPEPALPPAPEPREVVYAHYGDSLTAGGTVPRIQSHMPGTFHIDRSYGGTMVRYVLDGREPWAREPFAQAIQRDGADWIVMRWGGEVGPLRLPVDIVADVSVMVDIALAAGKRVALVGAFDAPLTDAITPEIRALYMEVDERLRVLAAERAITFVELLSIPVPPEDMYDTVHPGAAAQERHARHIARQLVSLLPPRSH
ncbi:SGNH/GDSL hydrolase family protein [Xenophilus sp. Marseille-Q4582]|uniref:SGNH/GDSL hydrolase family protein n=1 Tax=Xenophilus sp. Marseille-Q4582 TaxID=2866600 RepID=UPI001CE48A5F|nr:SGNH/GDSL hydrolase family protein [Xenophilus sp. Marseille-Q4582]